MALSKQSPTEPIDGDLDELAGQRIQHRGPERLEEQASAAPEREPQQQRVG